MAPVKKKTSLRTMGTRSPSSATNLPINLPECAKKILNKDLVIKMLPVTAGKKPSKTKRKVNSLSSVSNSSMTVKINSAPHIIRTYSKLSPEQKLNPQPAFTSTGKKRADSCSTVKINGKYPSAISKPRGATLNSANLSPSKSRKSAKLSRVEDSIKQLMTSRPTLPSKTERQPSLPAVSIKKLIKPSPTLPPKTEKQPSLTVVSVKQLMKPSPTLPSKTERQPSLPVVSFKQLMKSSPTLPSKTRRQPSLPVVSVKPLMKSSPTLPSKTGRQPSLPVVSVKPLMKSSPTLPSKTGRQPSLPVVQLSKLSDFKIFNKSKQLIVCSPNTSSRHIDLLRNRIFHANLPPNSKLSIVKQSPQPELSVVHISKMPSTGPNIGSHLQKLTFSSLLQLAVAKPGSTNKSQTCLTTESEKLVTNKLNPQLSVCVSSQEQPSSSLLKVNNNPILRERMNVETNHPKKSEVCNTVESSQEEIAVLPSNEPSPADEGHLNRRETVKVSVKNERRQSISTKQPQVKEKSVKLLKPNDENIVPIGSDLQVEVIDLEPPKRNATSKRLKCVKQPNFSSVMPEAKKIKTHRTSDTSIAVPVGVQNLKTRMSVKRCRNRTMEMDSLDSGFQMLDIDIFFPSNEFEIPDMDMLIQNLPGDV